MNSLLRSGGRAIDRANRFDSAWAIAKFPAASAQLLNRAKGSLPIGTDGDVAVLDPDGVWVFERGDAKSKPRNNPFYGWPFKGRVRRRLWVERKSGRRTLRLCLPDRLF